MSIPERIYTFKCPECGHVFSYNQPGEPLCDGPGAVAVHVPKVMHRIRVKDRNYTKEVSEAEGKARAKGTLLTPETLVGMGAKVYGELWVPDDGLDPLTGKEIHPSDEGPSAEVHDTGQHIDQVFEGD